MLGTFLTVSARTSRSSAEVYDLMMRIDREAKASMSIFEEGSLLSRVNNNETDLLDEHIIYCLNLSRRVSEQSGGVYVWFCCQGSPGQHQC